jgi:hypothetical protein
MNKEHKIGEYPIYFDIDGNQVPEVWKSYINEGRYQVVKNHIINDTLTYKSYHKWGVTVGFKLERSDGRTVNVFISDFDKMIPKLVDGKITGLFTFTKKGTRYGCRFLE